jgi:hypothetical protein
MLNIVMMSVKMLHAVLPRDAAPRKQRRETEEMNVITFH